MCCPVKLRTVPGLSNLPPSSDAFPSLSPFSLPPSNEIQSVVSKLLDNHDLHVSVRMWLSSKDLMLSARVSRKWSLYTHPTRRIQLLTKASLSITREPTELLSAWKLTPDTSSHMLAQTQGKFPCLQSLEIARVDEAITYLLASEVSAPVLSNLKLIGCSSITQYPLFFLTKFSLLRSLSLVEFHNVTETTFRSLLGACPGLTSLQLSWCQGLNKESMDVLVKQGLHLTSLDLSNSIKINDEAILSLLPLAPRLISLNLLGCSAFGRETMNNFLVKCSQLTALNLSECLEVNEKTLELLPRACPRLQSLSLAKCSSIDKDTLPLLSTLALHSLSLRECNQITHQTISTCATRFPSVTSLSLMGSSELNEVAIEAIPETFPHLRSLDLSMCVGATEKAVRTLVSRSHQLRSLTLLGHYKIRLAFKALKLEFPNITFR